VAGHYGGRPGEDSQHQSSKCLHRAIVPPRPTEQRDFPAAIATTSRPTVDSATGSMRVDYRGIRQAVGL
jgi:hypothetical protein